MMLLLHFTQFFTLSLSSIRSEMKELFKKSLNKSLNKPIFKEQNMKVSPDVIAETRQLL